MRPHQRRQPAASCLHVASVGGVPVPAARHAVVDMWPAKVVRPLRLAREELAVTSRHTWWRACALAGLLFIAGQPSFGQALTGQTQMPVILAPGDASVPGQGSARPRYSLYLPLIRGALFGTPNTPDVVVFSTNESGQLPVQFESIERAASKLAAKVDPELVNLGLSVEPESTRLARVATFAVDAPSGRGYEVTGFVDTDASRFVVLVYFDRPCRISGTIMVGDVAASHDLVVPGAGLYWMDHHVLTEAKFHVSLPSAARKVALKVSLPLTDQPYPPLEDVDSWIKAAALRSFPSVQVNMRVSTAEPRR